MRGFVFFITLCMLGFINPVTAQDTTDSVRNSGGIIGRFLDYIAESNKPKPAKKFDISFLGGPYYSSDTKLGIGLVAAGLYKSDLSDTITPPGNVSLYGNVSITGYYKIGIRGDQNFRRGKWRMNYNASFESDPAYYWGMGYAINNNDANKTKYKRWQTRVVFDLLRRIAPNTYIGPQLQVEYISGRHVNDRTLWNGQSMHTFTDGIGLVGVYDTRDNTVNAYSGVLLRLEQMFYPRFIGNKYAFSSTEFRISWYKQIWKGGVLASLFHTRLTYGNTPWGLMSKLGGSDTMRGYYEGRYNDKCCMDLTVELRQHIWGRSGAVAWVGAGQVFPNISGLRMRHMLPNFGIGYRWEFKKRVNVRIDYGFGKNHQSGFLLNVNEAF